MKGILLAGFGAIGKTTLAKKYDNIVDLESSNFKYIIDDNLKKIDVEKRKGLNSRKLNPLFPNNYYNAIIDSMKKYDYVLISMHNEIIDLLEKNNISYYVVYPDEEMLDEIIDRCKKRGNNDSFLSGIKEAYYRLYPHKSKNIIWIKKGQYLEEVLLQNNLLGGTNEINK